MIAWNDSPFELTWACLYTGEKEVMKKETGNAKKKGRNRRICFHEEKWKTKIKDTEISLRRSVCSRAETRAKESKMGEEIKKIRGEMIKSCRKPNNSKMDHHCSSSDRGVIKGISKWLSFY